MHKLGLFILLSAFAMNIFAQTNGASGDQPKGTAMPAIEPGVSRDLAKWRAEHYSDVRYKLNLTLEKMSPVLKGTIEIRVKVGAGTLLSPTPQGVDIPPIILDWRKIKGHDEKSTISSVSLNGRSADMSFAGGTGDGDRSVPAPSEHNGHLIFRDGVVIGENVIKLDFTSPILTSGSAITRYVDKEDGSEYIYSLFVPSDASTAFPVFDQPDLKARFDFSIRVDPSWHIIANTEINQIFEIPINGGRRAGEQFAGYKLAETKPISTYVFAFAAGPFEKVGEGTLLSPLTRSVGKDVSPQAAIEDKSVLAPSIYVRKSQAGKFKPHADEVFRLNREAIKYFEEYFDYKFPFPKYDLVLIPEFPFGGMEHAGATFLRESSIIFPQEPTRNDHISRALLIFHEASHQWFGDTVTMRWFDDLWLKEGFATFTAYKAMERIMPEMNAWKVFYERVKQAAYQTDSTKGTTPIYQEIPNLSAAKSAYGNIVYNKAPAFLRQAEFYLGEDKFQTAVRAFLKKHEFGNAGWGDLVSEFEKSSNQKLQEWAAEWVKQPGVPRMLVGSGEGSTQIGLHYTSFQLRQLFHPGVNRPWRQKIEIMMLPANNKSNVVHKIGFGSGTDTGGDSRGYWGKWFLIVQPLDYHPLIGRISRQAKDFVPSYPSGEILESRKFPLFIFPNYQDYGYGIFLLDEKSRDYVLKNIQNEKDPFLRSMMWGALWDSVREGELDPREYVELVVKVVGSEVPSSEVRSSNFSWPPVGDQSPPRETKPAKAGTPNEDESTTALLLNRVGTAMNYYVSDKTREELAPRIEKVFSDKMRTAPTLGQRITFYRAFLNAASSENARNVLKAMLKSEPPASAGGKDSPGTQLGETKSSTGESSPPAYAGGSDKTAAIPDIPLKTKDRFDIVTRLLILGDPEAPALLAELEKTETSDEAKRYAYAARAGIATAENKAKYWKDFTENKEISESWIEAAFGPWNSIRHSELTLPYLQGALQELPNHKRNRKIFFINGWLGAFIGGQRSEEALGIVNRFLADNPKLDNDLRLKILENADIIERAVKIRAKY